MDEKLKPIVRGILINVFNVSTQLKENQLQNACWKQEWVLVI